VRSTQQVAQLSDRLEVVGGEPSHHRGRYAQRPPPVRLSNSRHFHLCNGYARRVLQGAEGAHGLHAEAKMDW
jgi:hypothetical protein